MDPKTPAQGVPLVAPQTPEVPQPPVEPQPVVPPPPSQSIPEKKGFSKTFLLILLLIIIAIPTFVYLIVLPNQSAFAPKATPTIMPKPTIKPSPIPTIISPSATPSGQPVSTTPSASPSGSKTQGTLK